MSVSTEQLEAILFIGATIACSDNEGKLKNCLRFSFIIKVDAFSVQE